MLSRLINHTALKKAARRSITTITPVSDSNGIKTKTAWIKLTPRTVEPASHPSSWRKVNGVSSLSTQLRSFSSQQMPPWMNQSQAPGEALAKYSTDLTQMAIDGKLDPVIGRHEEIRRTLQILARRTKNNPILVGEPGAYIIYFLHECECERERESSV